MFAHAMIASPAESTATAGEPLCSGVPTLIGEGLAVADAFGAAASAAAPTTAPAVSERASNQRAIPIIDNPPLHDANVDGDATRNSPDARAVSPECMGASDARARRRPSDRPYSRATPPNMR